MKFFFVYCVVVSFFSPYSVGFYDNSKEANTGRNEKKTHESTVIDEPVQELVRYCCCFFLLFIHSVCFFFYCNFWQFTTFIIMTSIIYNYTLDSVVCFFLLFFLSLSLCFSSVSSECWFNVINEEPCWYWWRKRHWTKKNGIKQQKKTREICVNFYARAFCR